jgi:amidase
MALGLTAPTSDEIRRLANEIGWEPEPDELEAYTRSISAMTASLDHLDELAELETRPPRITDPRQGWSPSDDEDPLGAWAWRTETRGSGSGPLSGKRLAVKDNIAVAGLPLSNGTTFIKDFVPDFDATVVTRALASGATLAGKAACAPLSMSPLGTAGGRNGPVRNPHNPAFTSGGSSSGCGALVASRAVDLAIGGDQGGSIRIPAAMCGIYGLKPTWGLVPYTGAYAMNLPVDTLGPMAATVADLEALLYALAGPDNLDPRQHEQASLAPSPITRVEDLRVGVLQEGFAWPQSQPDVDAAVQDAALALGKLGARVRHVSVPGHRSQANLLIGLRPEVGHYLFDEFATGGPLVGFVDPAMLEAFNQWRTRPEELPISSKLALLATRSLREQCRGRAFAHSQNHTLALRSQYDDALKDVDVLLCPTMPTKAIPIASADVPAPELLELFSMMPLNTRQFNLTGHPALNIPCALSGDLPVGAQIVGRRGEDLLLVQVARWFEERVAAAPIPGGTRTSPAGAE